MKIIRDYQFVEKDDRGASVAIGNFDGVHIGHRSVIDLAQAAAPDAPLGVLTFEPHPREYFAPDAPPFRLMSQAAVRAVWRRWAFDISLNCHFIPAWLA